MLCNILKRHSNMITIRDIYQWYNNEYTNSPKPAGNLTPLQKIEWDRRNSQAVKEYKNLYKNKSFVGELLLASPTVLIEIKLNKIIANSNYIRIRMDQYSFEKEKYNPNGNNFVSDVELCVVYDIHYDQSFYETIKTIYENSMVEITGQILDFEQKYSSTDMGEYLKYTNLYIIKLELSSIKVVKRELLYSNLLNDKHHFYSGKRGFPCFIATAAYGSQDITEVIQLREFRDAILINSFIGRCFIYIYNILSPPLAFIIKQSNWLRKITRYFLRKIVLPLIEKNN